MNLQNRLICHRALYQESKLPLQVWIRFSNLSTMRVKIVDQRQTKDCIFIVEPLDQWILSSKVEETRLTWKEKGTFVYLTTFVQSSVYLKELYKEIESTVEI